MEKGIVYIDGIKNVNTSVIQNSTSLKGIFKEDNSNTESMLSLGVIDKNKKQMYESIELVLCKPNKEEIAILSDAYDRELDTMFIDVDELRFNVPYYIEKQYEQVVNPNWDLIKENYLVKIGNKCFTIESTSIDGDTTKEVKRVQCYSLEYQLAKRNLRGMRGTRQLYKGINDGTVVKIKYSLDGLVWNTYSTPFQIMDNVTVHFQTLDNNSVVLNSFSWNANNKVNETQGVTINCTLLDITQGNIAKKLLVAVRIISEIGEGILNILEKETTWKVGYIDSSVREDTSTGQVHRRYRTFDIAEKAWLEVIRDDIQKAFGCYVFFDTDKKELNIYNALTYRNNKGLYISEKNYIKSIKKNVKDTEIITRLHVYGKDNKSIATINPTGETYIENLDHYRNIKYMPRDLLDAMDLYFGSLDGSINGLLNSKSGTFTQLYNELQDLRLKQLRLENERAELQAKYKIADNEVDFAIQSHNKNNTLPTIITGTGENSENISQSIIQLLSDVNVPRNLSALNAVRNLAKQAVDIKDLEIEQNETETQNKLDKITDLKNLLAKDRKTSIFFDGVTYPINFTMSQINLLDEFIKESSWQNDIYVDFHNAYELLSEGIVALDKLSKPRVEIEVDIIDFLNIVECQRDWDKLEIGDMVNIFYDKLNISIESRLIKISHNIDSNSLSITISTDDEVDDPTKYLSQIAGNASDASNSIDMSKSNWDLAMVNQDQISQIINNSLDTAKNRVLSGRNQNIILDERGIAMRDMFNNNEQLRMLNNVIAFTRDNWETCSTAISPMGVIAQELYGKIVGSNRLIITNMNDSGESSFLVDKNHMKAINMDLSLLNKSQTNRIYLNPEIGIKIQKKIGGDWSDILWLGMDGRIQSKYMVTTNLEIRNDDGDLLLNSETNYLNVGKFDTITSDGMITALEKLSVRKEWLRIQTEYPKVIIQATKFNTSQRDDSQLVNTSSYTSAYLALSSYITPLLSNMEKPSPVVQSEFDTKFGNYYSAVKDVLNKIEDSLKYSSLQLGGWYNHTLIDAINGITVEKVDASGDNAIARTVLNATTGISISTKKDGVWEDNFWVDTNGYLVAKNLMILDEFGRPAFVADDKGELDLEGRMRVMRYLDDTINSQKVTLIDIYKDDPKGGKILVNNWEGKKNIFMGSSPDTNYNGGFLKMYNDQEKPRIELGTYTSEDAGRINLMGVDDKAKISLSAIDDEGDSAGVIKLFDKLNNPMIFISSDTSQNTMSRQNAQITIGKTTNTPKIGLYGGHDDFGGFIELSDKHGIPNVSIGDISLGSLSGGMQVLYANMGSNTPLERQNKRRLQLGVFNDGVDGQVQFYNSSGVMIGRVTSEGGDMNIYGKESTCFVKLKSNGDIDIDAGTGNVNIKGAKINLN